MNIKALRPLLIAATMVLPPLTHASAAEPKTFPINQENFRKLPAADQARVLEIKSRLETVVNMDRTDLARVDRKALRKEIRNLRSEAEAYNRNGTVIYLSTAGIIIIILLLILLL